MKELQYIAEPILHFDWFISTILGPASGFGISIVCRDNFQEQLRERGYVLREALGKGECWVLRLDSKFFDEPVDNVVIAKRIKSEIEYLDSVGVKVNNRRFYQDKISKLLGFPKDDIERRYDPDKALNAALEQGIVLRETFYVCPDSFIEEHISEMKRRLESLEAKRRPQLNRGIEILEEGISLAKRYLSAIKDAPELKND